VEQIFGEAVTRRTASERAAFLDLACGADIALRARVEALLAAHEAPASFLPLPERDVAEVRSVDLVAARSGETIGPYKLLQTLSEGGFGVVFLAEQEQPLQRRVALKVIKLGMDTRQVIARFEVERQALAIMDHPGIARVFDAGSTAGGRPYF